MPRMRLRAVREDAAMTLLRTTLLADRRPDHDRSPVFRYGVSGMQCLPCCVLTASLPSSWPEGSARPVSPRGQPYPAGSEPSADADLLPFRTCTHGISSSLTRLRRPCQPQFPVWTVPVRIPPFRSSSAGNGPFPAPAEKCIPALHCRWACKADTQDEDRFRIGSGLLSVCKTFAANCHLPLRGVASS